MHEFTVMDTKTTSVLHPVSSMNLTRAGPWTPIVVKAPNIRMATTVLNAIRLSAFMMFALAL